MSEERGERAAETEAAWLGELLDAAAAEYEPDTERLRALVAARIGESPDEEPVPGRPRGGRRPRRLAALGRVGIAGIPAGAALATIGAAAALAVGATATIAVTNSNHDTHGTVSVLTPHGGGSGAALPSQSTSTLLGPTATGSAGSSRPSSPGSTASTSASGAPPVSASATGAGPGNGAGAGDGGNAPYSATVQVDPDGSGNPNWSQLDVMVTTRQPLSSLQITIKVADCPSMAPTGEFDSGAIGQFGKAQTSNPDGSATYTFVLESGQTVSPGTLEFAAQFNHAASGWSATQDTYVIDGRTAASTADTVVQGTY